MLNRILVLSHECSFSWNKIYFAVEVDYSAKHVKIEAFLIVFYIYQKGLREILKRDVLFFRRPIKTNGKFSWLISIEILGRLTLTIKKNRYVCSNTCWLTITFIVIRKIYDKGEYDKGENLWQWWKSMTKMKI